MVTFTGSVTTPTGLVLPASGSVDILASVRMLIGIDPAQTTTDFTTTVPHLLPSLTGPARVFVAAGKPLPSWATGVLGAVPTSWIPHVSWKDFPTQSAFLAWLSAIPNRWREIWLSFHHEPEGDLDPALFVSQWKQLLAWAAPHPNRHLLKMGPVLTWYAQTYKTFTPDEFWPGDQADFTGWDIYPAGKSNWSSAATVTVAPVAFARKVGKPLVVSELGVVCSATPTATELQARAAWMNSVLAALKASGVCQSVAWWNTTGPQGNFALNNDQYGLAAWRAAIANQ